MMLDPTVADNSRRIGELEVTMGKISVTLKHNDERARERFEVLSTSAVEIKDILKERDKECREYRGRREELEQESDIARQKWLQSLFNPQTLWIILSITLAAVGMKSIDMAELIEVTSSGSTSP
tara:strand:- start:10549 stop:10920 length:372 start_codon:yes stop_codon:yes gene_type:complete